MCAYKVFYLQIFRRIEKGWNPSPLPGPYVSEKSVVLRGLNVKFFRVQNSLFKMQIQQENIEHEPA